MPRDGSNIYHRPVGTDAVTDTTIESTKYNSNVADVEQDLNLPRPIVAGGTGATTAAQAMINLGGEVTLQNVTNYDSFPFVSGSFYSNAGTTSEPVAGHPFVGICYVHGNPAFVILEARDLNDSTVPGRKYIRQKLLGTWGAWIVDPLAADVASKVSKSGDAMTGPLTITGSLTATSVLSAATSSTGSYYFGSGSTKFLNYDGTSFSLNGGPFYQHGGSAFFDSDLTLGSLTAAATLRFGNIANKYLNYDGTNFILNGGQLIHHGGNALHDNDMTIGASTTAATLRFGNTGTKYLNYDGINFVFAGGSITGSGASLGNGVYAALSVPLQIGFTGGGTQYGMSFRPAADNTTLQYFVNAAGTNNGSISQTVSAVAYNTASSAELKEDLKSFDAGSIIDQTNVYDFKWKSSSERAYGVIAQQAVDVYPLAVTHSKQDGIDDEFWGVDYSKYVPVLLQELKALRARVADLEGRLISGAQPA